MSKPEFIQVKTCHYIEDEAIEALLVTVCEGGINYWASNMERTGTSEGEDFYSHVVAGGQFQFHDDEEGATRGPFDISTLGAALQRCHDEGHDDSIARFISEQYDAEDADVIFQFWTLGDLTYG